jgi:N-acetylneuraminic acid mutarotase
MNKKIFIKNILFFTLTLSIILHMIDFSSFKSTVFADVTDSKWSFKENMPFPNAGVICVDLNGEIYVMGGKPTGQVVIYNPLTDNWKQGIGLITARTGLSAIKYKNRIYTFGGWKDTWLKTVEAYDPDAEKWLPMKDMNIPRQNFAVAELNGKIYAIGGMNGNGYLKQVEEYDPQLDTWVQKKDMPDPKYNSKAFTINGKIYVIGGMTSPSDIYDKIDEYDPQADKWTTVSTLPSERKIFSSSVANGKIFIFGGQNKYDELLKSVDAYAPVANKWYSYPNMQVARNSPGSICVNNTIYVIGGYDGNQEVDIMEGFQLDRPQTSFYDAEDGKLTPYASIEISKSVCHGDRYVRELGNGLGTCTISVNVSSSGKYTVRIYYLTGEDRSFYVSVNEESGVQVKCPSSGSFFDIAYKDVLLDLIEGGNTIKFYNNSGWCPDFDGIEILTSEFPTATASPTATLLPTPTFTPTLTPTNTNTASTPILIDKKSYGSSSSVYVATLTTPTLTPTQTPTQTPTYINTYTPSLSSEVKTPIPTSGNLIHPTEHPPSTIGLKSSRTITSNFSDLEGHWAKGIAVKFLQDGIITGYPDGTLKLDAFIDRAETIILVAKSINIQPSESTDLKFQDVSDIPEWTKGYLQAVVQKNIIKGYDDNTFRAQEKLTRAQIIVIVMRAFGFNQPSGQSLKFSDTREIPGWALESIKSAYNLGIVEGYKDSTLRPKRPVTRGEVLAIISKCRDIKRGVVLKEQ